jgi:hypothetical protein
MKAIGAVAGLVILTTSAVCAELPQYDIDASCKRAAASTGAAEEGTRRVCVLMEKQRAKEIAARLDTIDSEALGRCAAQAHDSYSVLGGCLGVPSEMRATVIEVEKAKP